jgi:ribosomal protein S6--L-glutamate ligase
MEIAILAVDFEAYTNKRLATCLESRGHKVHLARPFDCMIQLEDEQGEIKAPGASLSQAEIVLLRCAVLRHRVTPIRYLETVVASQLKLGGAICINDPQAKMVARDKLLTLQTLNQHGLPIPKTYFAWDAGSAERIIKNKLDMPIIMKTTEGTWGIGTMQADSLASARSILDTMQWGMQRAVILQEYVQEAQGRDIRVLVIGHEAVGAIRKVARAGEFRANAHREARSEKFDLPPAYADLAVKATRVMGLEMAGVDLLESQRGPLVLEVNSCPGIKALEAQTGLDVALHMAQYLEERAKEAPSQTGKPNAKGQRGKEAKV